ncbi:hypothetical protein ABTH73_19780, partial [Acinetobacter baumannii]
TSDYTPFTVDEFLEKADMLKPMESLGNFEKTTRFACDFLHGDNVVTGEFRKNDRKLSHLVIVGSGEDWKRAELIAVSLASKSEN